MKTPTVRAVIQGKEINRNEILRWEASRLPKAAKRIGLPLRSKVLSAQRLAFADAKLAIGAEEVRRRLATQLWLSDLIGVGAAGLSGERRALSVCDLYVTGGNAASFVDWFMAADRPDYLRTMVAAHPDHFLFATTADGRMEVIETTGGSPTAARLLINFQDHSVLRTKPDPTCPVSITGVARSGGGTAMGGVRHEFRDVKGGFHARLLVEFPFALPSYMLRLHSKHLAVEFSNWIEIAFGGITRMS